MFTTTLTAFLLPILAAAQYGNNGPTTAPTTSSAAPVPSAPADTTGQLNIDVNFNANFTFHPASIIAPNGTLVTFWIPNNGFDHSITQSTFTAPCTYLAASGNSTIAGFDSGLQSSKKFTINITDDTKPIWYHCKQLNHCGMGMVGSINAPTTGNTFDSFLANAMKIGTSEVSEVGADKGFVAGGVNAIATTPVSSIGGSSNPPSGSSGATQITVSAGLALVVGAVAFILV